MYKVYISSLALTGLTNDPIDDVTEMASTVEKLVGIAIEWLKDFFPAFVGAILILIIGMWLSGLISNIVAKAMKRAKIGTEVVTFVHSFVKIALKIVVIVAAVGTLGFNIASLITALGAATVAIGLALQDTLKNVASGLMVLVNKPFKVGDYVQINGFEGTVSKIDISNTHMLTIDKKEIIIPNANVTSNNITNYSSQEKRIVDLKYSVAYSSDIDKVKSVIKKVIAKNSKIYSDPEPFITVGAHEDNSVQIVVRIWCDTAEYWNVYFYMQENILAAFKENDITIPFMQIDLHSS